MRRILVIFGVFLSLFVFGQQEPLFTQYYTNNMPINPAVSGSRSYNFLAMSLRQQWLGFEGAPLTTNISYHGVLNNRSAMGGYLMFDKTTPSSQANLHLNYAYHVPLNYNNVYLSFGLGAKVMYYNLDFNVEDLPSDYDPAFSSEAYDNTLGDASAGTYLYGRRFYLGISAIDLFQSSFNSAIENSSSTNNLFRSYYFMGAYQFDIINKDWKLEPSFLLRKQSIHKNIIDITTRIIYIKDSWSAITYRTDGTVAFAFGFGKNNMTFSYSYDYTVTGDIMKHSYGTHEIGIGLKLETLMSKRHVTFWGY